MRAIIDIIFIIISINSRMNNHYCLFSSYLSFILLFSVIYLGSKEKGTIVVIKSYLLVYCLCENELMISINIHIISF